MKKLLFRARSASSPALMTLATDLGDSFRFGGLLYEKVSEHFAA